MNKTYLYTKFRNFQRGAIMVLFAVLLPVLFGFMGFSIDLGLAYVEHGKMQDIADAAALAGAAHLGDSDRDTTVKDAVKAYVEANGLKLGANDLVNKADGSAWDAKDTLAKGQDALVSYGIVSVTNNGETKDRVRVRITKRAPLFFFNVLGDFSDGMVVAAKAAAEGGSVASNVTYTGKTPVFMSTQLFQAYQSADQLLLSGATHYSIYAKNENLFPEKLPGSGMIYAANPGNRGYGKYDVMNEVVVYDNPMPAGWEFTPSNTTATSYEVYNTWGVPQEKLDIAAAKKAAQIADGQEKHDLYDRLQQEAINNANSMAADKQAYIDGVKNGTNKRYIGPIPNPEKPSEEIVVSTVLSTDTEIDLYVDGTALLGGESKKWMNTPWNVLTNFQLKNVKKINNIYFSNQNTIISTEGIIYGNVYGTTSNFGISGKKNAFTGTVYGPGNIWFGGNENRFAPSEGVVSIVAPSCVYFGMDYAKVSISLVEENGEQLHDVKLTMTNNGEYAGMDPSWKMYFDFGGLASSSGEGETGTGTGTVTSLRLVE